MIALIGTPNAGNGITRNWFGPRGDLFVGVGVGMVGGFMWCGGNGSVELLCLLWVGQWQQAGICISGLKNINLEKGTIF